MKLNHLLITASLSTLLISAPLYAGSGHDSGHGSSQPTDHSAMGQGGGQMFLEKREIDGYSVSFHVMEAAEGMRHGGSHNLMVKVEQGANAIGELQANSKVIYPDGKEESKPLMQMGDWFMAGYDLKPGGQHQLMVLFKTADGKKHFGGVHYGQ